MPNNFEGIKSILEAPVFRPNEKEFFNGPIDYIENIKSSVLEFGICRIIPPPVSIQLVLVRTRPTILIFRFFFKVISMLVYD